MTLSGSSPGSCNDVNMKSSCILTGGRGIKAAGRNEADATSRLAGVRRIFEAASVCSPPFLFVFFSRHCARAAGV
jgi:hypothetical protein